MCQRTVRPSSPQRHRELTDRLIWFPLPMRALLRDSYRAADDATRARLLEVRTRRYYRIRELTGLQCQKLGQHLTCLADYANSAPGGEPTHLVSAYVPLAELPGFAQAVAPHLRSLPPGRQIVVDIDSWRSEPFSTGEDMARELAGLLAPCPVRP